MSAASFDTSVPDAHGDADISFLQCRRIVDAVTGHRDNCACPTQRVDDAQLVFRIHTRVNGYLGDGTKSRVRG